MMFFHSILARCIYNAKSFVLFLVGEFRACFSCSSVIFPISWVSRYVGIFLKKRKRKIVLSISLSTFLSYPCEVVNNFDDDYFNI
jgi:hypothetical protein